MRSDRSIFSSLNLSLLSFSLILRQVLQYFLPSFLHPMFSKVISWPFIHLSYFFRTPLNPLFVLMLTVTASRCSGFTHRTLRHSIWQHWIAKYYFYSHDFLCFSVLLYFFLFLNAPAAFERRSSSIRRWCSLERLCFCLWLLFFLPIVKIPIYVAFISSWTFGIMAVSTNILWTFTCCFFINIFGHITKAAMEEVKLLFYLFHCVCYPSAHHVMTLSCTRLHVNVFGNHAGWSSDEH